MRMWRKGNSHILLLEMQTDSTTIRNNKEAPKKLKNMITIWYSNLNSVYISQGNKALFWKEISTPMLIAARFTVVKLQKPPKFQDR